ncbi:hypothetical protein QR680_005395 [Steinernema hermaphroditum]|uniref:Small ribosomal subunit protein mS35 mitochondrial conserved domain-containing protein n=1 Tax=Steinernema hermaphroditum TaxID=289476 RepID=A0AA39HU28_9BILA|nr:hypothetical protein QR680_005395 [Steinernema hermaphroditum]
MLSIFRGSVSCRIVPSLSSVRTEATLAEKMKRAAMGIDQQETEAVQRERVENELDDKGEPFREAFVKPKRKLNAQLQLERMTGRAEVEKFSRTDLMDRLAVRRPRHEEMSTDQDWPSVWPTAASFKASVVPLPVRMGSRPNPDRRPPFKKVGNLELVKIPNFLHLTPEAIERQCNAIKKFCTPWPKELKEVPELSDKYLPMQISYSDYIHQGTSLRDGRARLCTVTMKLADLKLDEKSREKFIRLVGSRYDEESDVLTIVTDRCHTRKQNRDYAMYLLTVLFRESKKRESWEQLAERRDNLKVQFEGSQGEKHLKEIVEKSDGLEDLKKGNINKNPKIRKFAEVWHKYRNEKETAESTRSYSASVRDLLGIQSLDDKCKVVEANRAMD